MASTVTFYNTPDDPRTIGKTMSQVGNGESVTVKGNINVLYPTFVLKYNPALTGANYFTWNGRFYFITDITLGSAEQMVISGAVDVLETYKDSIVTCPATCIRWQGEGKPTFVVDKSLPIEENRSENVNVNFGNSFQGTFFNSDPQYMFITI